MRENRRMRRKPNPLPRRQSPGGAGEEERFSHRKMKDRKGRPVEAEPLRWNCGGIAWGEDRRDQGRSVGEEDPAFS